MYGRIIGGVLIQLSDEMLQGYKPVVEELQPEFDPETQYLAYSYEIIGEDIHKIYRAEDIVFDDDETSPEHEEEIGE